MKSARIHGGIPQKRNVCPWWRKVRSAICRTLHNSSFRSTIAAFAGLLTFAANLAILHYFTVNPTHDGKAKWIIGTSKIDITPTEKVWLSGFASRNRTADSVLPLSPLYVRAVAIRNVNAPKVPYVIVSADVIGLHRKLSDRIYSTAVEDFGLSRERLRICVTHTHSGPVVGDNLAPLVPDDAGERAKIARYTEKFFSSVMSAIGESLYQEIHANGHFQRGTAKLAVNRREVSENDYDGLRRGTTEDSVPVLWFTNRGYVVAGLFGYAAHATVLTTNYRYSGDFVGLATLQLERQGGTWLFLAGCGGDQNVYPRGSYELAAHHAKTLFAAVVNVTRKATALEMFQRISAQHSYVRLSFQKRYNAKELRYRARSQDRVRRRAALLLLEKSSSDGFTPPDYHYGIALWHIGGVPIVFLGGEPTVGYCHLLQNIGITWVVGYCEDVMGYIGTRSVIDSGGREGGERAAWYYGLPSAWSAGIEEVIVGAVQRMLERR